MLLFGVLGLDVREHFKFVELVHAQDAAGVFAVAAGLAAIAGAPTGVAHRAFAEVENLVAVVTGERNLACTCQVEVVGR
ncbi:unannotated protein [freshwater metagenome]|uniref:Unannotated protein n=1 Tax=freshwater metagenome TaxID=449393 RepID=A0A6J7KI66_9ZZZZ